MTQRSRSPSGISLQNYRSDVQLALLDHSDAHSHKYQTADRQLSWAEYNIIGYAHHDEHPPINLIVNTKYNLFTFVPLVLYQQFQYFFNLFYLITALSQFIPILKVGLLFSFVAPLVLVLLLTMVKEGYEDYQRFLKDKEINNATFKVICKDKYVIKKSSQISVGDILEVNTGDNIPADCIFLASLTDKPSLFIKTDQLDGETDWKLRKSIFPNKNAISPFVLEFQDPKANIYEFVAAIQIDSQQKIGLGLQNTMWRGVKVASGQGYAMVVYLGKQTKLSLNMKDPQNKFGKLDEQLNFFSKLLFLIMVILSVTLIILRGSYGHPGQVFILTFKYFLLLSSIIPISMRVNLDFAKLVYKYLIDRDKLMENALCRNSNITEQLGRISYILSDKTGTLTQNEMIFRKLYLSEQIKLQAEQIASAVKDAQGQGPSRIKSMLAALMLCHNVTPVVQSNGENALQGSSPDQLTLVKFGQSLHYTLLQRTQEHLSIKMPSGKIIQYQILDMFPFTSQTKSMTIVVREKGNDKIMVYVKGADAVIQSKIAVLDAQFMREACVDLAREGLRTLVFTQKAISNDSYLQWKKEYSQASSSLKNREQKVLECLRVLQEHLTFVGVSGVEDKLQNGVSQTISSTRSIGIKVWMLTGDKIQTAICVGRAVRLISTQDQGLFVVENINNLESFKKKLDQMYQVMRVNRESILQAKTLKYVLVIDGASLKQALSPQLEEQFFNLAVKLPAIICSRVSPTQKAQIALLVIKYSGNQGRVLGIGDGGNDVALIQAAHVGVGIYGKEGIQAALASDFSISQFSDLNSLLYWHGRLAYKRSSLLAQFIIHRGVIITIMQTLFIIQFYFVPLPIYNGFLLLGYSTIFTMLPVFSLILDEDITRRLAMEYPILYKNLLQGNQVSLPTFTYWLFVSIYQGSIIMILITAILTQQSFYMTSTVSFTCLIVIQFLNIFTELTQIKWPQIVSTIVSALVYTGSLLLMRKNLNGAELFTWKIMLITLGIVAVAWLPVFGYERIKRLMEPTQEQKMMQQQRDYNK